MSGVVQLRESFRFPPHPPTPSRTRRAAKEGRCVRHAASLTEVSAGPGDRQGALSIFMPRRALP